MFITVPTSYIQYRSSNGIADEYFRPDNSTTLHSRGTLVGYNTANQYVSTSANKRPTDSYFYVNEFTKFDENMNEQWVCGIMSPYIYPSIMVRSKFCPNEAYAIFTPDPTQWRSGEIVWTMAKAPSNEAIALAKAGALLNDSNWATKTPDALVNLSLIHI